MWVFWLLRQLKKVVVCVARSLQWGWGSKELDRGRCPGGGDPCWVTVSWVNLWVMPARGRQVCDLHKRYAQGRAVVTVRFSLFIILTYVMELMVSISANLCLTLRTRPSFLFVGGWQVTDMYRLCLDCVCAVGLYWISSNVVRDRLVWKKVILVFYQMGLGMR